MRSFSASLDNVSNAVMSPRSFQHLSKRKTTSSRCSFRMRFNFTNRAFVFSIFSRTESTSTSTMAECIHSVEMDWKVSNCSRAFSLIVNSRFASSSARKVKEVDISMNYSDSLHPLLYPRQWKIMSTFRHTTLVQRRGLHSV